MTSTFEEGKPMIAIEDMNLSGFCGCGDPDCNAWSCECGSTDVEITGCSILTDAGSVQVSVDTGVLPQPPSDGEIRRGVCVIHVMCTECEKPSVFGLHSFNGALRVVDGHLPP